MCLIERSGDQRPHRIFCATNLLLRFNPLSHTTRPHSTLDAPNSSMLQHTAARGRAFRQVPRAAWNRSKSPFTTFTHTARHAATGRGEADCIYRPRGMMSSSPAGPSRISGTETYLDHTSSPDIGFDHIKSTMTCTKFHDSIWGFVVRHTPHSPLNMV